MICKKFQVDSMDSILEKSGTYMSHCLMTAPSWVHLRVSLTWKAPKQVVQRGTLHTPHTNFVWDSFPLVEHHLHLRLVATFCVDCGYSPWTWFLWIQPSSGHSFPLACSFRMAHHQCSAWMSVCWWVGVPEQHETTCEVIVGAVLYERIDDQSIKEKIKYPIPGLLGMPTRSVGILLLVKLIDCSHPEVVVCWCFWADDSHQRTIGKLPWYFHSFHWIMKIRQKVNIFSVMSLIGCDMTFGAPQVFCLLELVVSFQFLGQVLSVCEDRRCS